VSIFEVSEKQKGKQMKIRRPKVTGVYTLKNYIGCSMCRSTFELADLDDVIEYQKTLDKVIDHTKFIHYDIVLNPQTELFEGFPSHLRPFLVVDGEDGGMIPNEYL